MSATDQEANPGCGRRVVEVIGLCMLLFLLFSGAREFWQSRADAFGPPELEERDLTLAPGIQVEILSSAGSLRESRFDAFDVSPDGEVLVLIGTRLVALHSGEEVFTEDVAVQSFAFAQDVLAITNMQNELGFLAQGRFELAGPAPMPTCRLRPTTDHTRLLFLRSDYDSNTGQPALMAMHSGQEPIALTGSNSPLTTAGGDVLQTYFSEKGSLFRLLTTDLPSMVFMLPEEDVSITGICVAGSTLYFSTEKAVYVLEEGIAIPLVLGAGGDLRLVEGALYVLDSASGRALRIMLTHPESS